MLDIHSSYTTIEIYKENSIKIVQIKYAKEETIPHFFSLATPAAYHHHTTAATTAASDYSDSPTSAIPHCTLRQRQRRYVLSKSNTAC